MIDAKMRHLLKIQRKLCNLLTTYIQIPILQKTSGLDFLDA